MANSDKKPIGDASIIISFNESEGFTVKHGLDKSLLVQLFPENCQGDEWDQLWATIDQIVDRTT